MEGRETYRRIAEIVRTTSSSLCNWIGWFRQGGLEELLGHANGAGGGKAPRFSPPQWERFRAELARGTWRTARDAQRWLRETLGLKIASKATPRCPPATCSKISIRSRRLSSAASAEAALLPPRRRQSRRRRSCHRW